RSRGQSPQLPAAVPARCAGPDGQPQGRHAAHRHGPSGGQGGEGGDAAGGPPPDDRNPRSDAVRDTRLPPGMSISPDDITPPMTAERAADIARGFDLRALPADFLANPYPVYRALREHDPV